MSWVARIQRLSQIRGGAATNLRRGPRATRCPVPVPVHSRAFLQLSLQGLPDLHLGFRNVLLSLADCQRGSSSRAPSEKYGKSWIVYCRCRSLGPFLRPGLGSTALRPVAARSGAESRRPAAGPLLPPVSFRHPPTVFSPSLPPPSLLASPASFSAAGWLLTGPLSACLAPLIGRLA
jgi:hypothetical protein